MYGILPSRFMGGVQVPPSVPQRGIGDAKRIDLSTSERLAGAATQGRSKRRRNRRRSDRWRILQNLEWVKRVSPAEFAARIQPRPAIANWIKQQTFELGLCSAF